MPAAVITPLLESLADVMGRHELELVERAYERAALFHEGEFRYSGEPYIEHPVAVAALVAQARPDAVLISVALLHDVSCDRSRDASWLTAEFGTEIADLVQQVAESSYEPSPDAGDAALLVKVCDRLHNMQTLHPFDADGRRDRSRRTIEVFVPLARRLGLDPTAEELESLAHGWLSPGAAFGMIRVAAYLLPGAARRRYVLEWSAELAAFDRGRGRYQAELMLGLPALAWTLWAARARAFAWERSAGPTRALLSVLVRTPLRPWLLLTPLLLLLTWQTARQGLAEALTFVVTVPPRWQREFGDCDRRSGLITAAKTPMLTPTDSHRTLPAAPGNTHAHQPSLLFRRGNRLRLRRRCSPDSPQCLTPERPLFATTGRCAIVWQPELTNR